jgi:hypothetical protein
VTAITKADDVAAADDYLKKLKEMAEVILNWHSFSRMANQKFIALMSN